MMFSDFTDKFNKRKSKRALRDLEKAIKLIEKAERVVITPLRRRPFQEAVTNLKVCRSKIQRDLEFCQTLST